MKAWPKHRAKHTHHHFGPRQMQGVCLHLRCRQELLAALIQRFDSCAQDWRHWSRWAGVRVMGST